MASRLFSAKQSLEREVKDIYIKMTSTGASDPTVTTYGAQGVASIVRTDTGEYEITLLDDVWAEVKYAKAMTQDTTARDLTYQITAGLDPAARTLTLTSLTSGTPTDVPDTVQVLIKLEVKASTWK